MAKLDNAQTFTSTLSSAKAAIVRGIADAGLKSFRSDAVKEDGTERWVEAWKDPVSGLWDIERHTGLIRSDRQAGTETQETLETGLCFFDALYRCGVFEKIENESAMIVAAADSAFLAQSELTDYREAAKAACQPLDDVTGLPAPAAYGRILADGTYSAEDKALARKTAQQDVTPVAENTAQQQALTLVSSNIFQTRDLPAIAGTDKISSAVDRQIQVNAIMRFDEAVDKMFKGMHEVAENQYKGFLFRKNEYVDPDKIFVGMGYVLTAGILPAVAYALRRKWVSPQRWLDGQINEMTAAADDLPNIPEKKLAQDFVKAACATAYLERAAYIHDACSKGRYRPGKLASGEALINKAAAKGFLPESYAAALRKIYLTQEFPGAGHFQSLLKEQWHMRDKYYYSALSQEEYDGKQAQTVYARLGVRVNLIRGGAGVPAPSAG